MSQSPGLSRYHPTVIAATSVAVFFAAYYLYSAYSEPAGKTTLRRSNAVYRARGDRRRTATSSIQPTISYRPPTDEAPLGSLWIETDDSGVLETNLATRGMPDDLDNQFYLRGGVPQPDFQHDICIASIESVLQASLLAINPQRRERLARMGLEGLPEAMAERNIDAIRGFASNINTILPRVTLDQIEAAIVKFSTTEVFANGVESSVDNDTYAETEDADGAGPARHSEPSHGLKGLLYHIAETDAKRKAYEHRGINCEECGEQPIRGIRWHCLNCPDFDLCSTCEANTEHPKTHVLAKVKIPLPVLSQPTKEYPLWYPGDPRKLHPPLDITLSKRLQEEYGFDAPQIDANYDQFISIANVPWPGDPNGVESAIDRRAFNKAMTSDRWPHRNRLNALYDRMFAFYDTNMDGLIGFEEFISGRAYIRGPKRFDNLRRALQGFDLDGDGLIDRKDFIVILRAKYEIQKLLVSDMVESRENEQTDAAMDTLRSSQPISSVFSMEEIPQGQERPRTGKAPDRYGDLQPSNDTKTILGDHEGFIDHAPTRHRSNNGISSGSRANGRSSHHSSRFEEFLGSPAGDGSAEHAGSNDGASDTHASLHSVDQQPFDLPRLHLELEIDEPDHDGLSADFLWRVVEFGFHEMLDPLFLEHEKDDRLAINSRAERELYGSEIAEFLRGSKEAEERDAAIAADPLMATAMSSSFRRSSTETSTDSEPGQNGFAAEMVPTDPVSLERLEKSIAEKPLDDLLGESGYGVIANENDMVHRDSFWTSPIPGESDPTMPQNRPNTSDPTSAKPLPAGQKTPNTYTNGHFEPKLPISREQLQHLTQLAERDRDMKWRGGIGKMNYKEILDTMEERDDNTLLGLTISWLDLASF